MAKNTPTATAPLWFTFKHYTELDDRLDIIDLMRVYGPNVDRADNKRPGFTTNYEGEAWTRAKKVGMRWADQIQYAITVQGVTRNDQLAITLQLSGSEFILSHPDDNLSSVPGNAPERWENSVYMAEGMADLESKYGDATTNVFTELVAELVVRGITRRPAFFLMDVEDVPQPYSACGGNANGTYGNGNFAQALLEVRAATEIILHTRAGSPKGGASDRTLATIAAGMSARVTTQDARNSTNIAFSREYHALIYMCLDSGMDRTFYQKARAAMPNSYTTSTPIKCGNYRGGCHDRTGLPMRARTPIGARITTARADMYSTSAFVTDVYSECNCRLLYPDVDLFESDPDAPTDGAFVINTGTGAGLTSTDNRMASRWLWWALNRSAKQGSLYSADLDIPWQQWPNIGNGQFNGGASREYSNGRVYPWHTEDQAFLCRDRLRLGQYRGIFWGWNSDGVGEDSDPATLTNMLDNDVYPYITGILGPF